MPHYAKRHTRKRMKLGHVDSVVDQESATGKVKKKKKRLADDAAAAAAATVVREEPIRIELGAPLENSPEHDAPPVERSAAADPASSAPVNSPAPESSAARESPTPPRTSGDGGLPQTDSPDQTYPQWPSPNPDPSTPDRPTTATHASRKRKARFSAIMEETHTTPASIERASSAEAGIAEILAEWSLPLPDELDDEDEDGQEGQTITTSVVTVAAAVAEAAPPPARSEGHEGEEEEEVPAEEPAPPHGSRRYRVAVRARRKRTPRPRWGGASSLAEHRISVYDFATPEAERIVKPSSENVNDDGDGNQDEQGTSVEGEQDVQDNGTNVNGHAEGVPANDEDAMIVDQNVNQEEEESMFVDDHPVVQYEEREEEGEQEEEVVVRDDQRQQLNGGNDDASASVLIAAQLEDGLEEAMQRRHSGASNSNNRSRSMRVTNVDDHNEVQRPPEGPGSSNNNHEAGPDAEALAGEGEGEGDQQSGGDPRIVLKFGPRDLESQHFTVLNIEAVDKLHRLMRHPEWTNRGRDWEETLLPEMSSQAIMTRSLSTRRLYSALDSLLSELDLVPSSASLIAQGAHLRRNAAHIGRRLSLIDQAVRELCTRRLRRGQPHAPLTMKEACQRHSVVNDLLPMVFPVAVATLRRASAVLAQYNSAKEGRFSLPVLTIFSHLVHWIHNIWVALDPLLAQRANAAASRGRNNGNGNGNGKKGPPQSPSKSQLQKADMQARRRQELDQLLDALGRHVREAQATLDLFETRARAAGRRDVERRRIEREREKAVREAEEQEQLRRDEELRVGLEAFRASTWNMGENPLTEYRRRRMELWRTVGMGYSTMSQPTIVEARSPTPERQRQRQRQQPRQRMGPINDAVNLYDVDDSGDDGGGADDYNNNNEDRYNGDQHDDEDQYGTGEYNNEEGYNEIAATSPGGDHDYNHDDNDHDYEPVPTSSSSGWRASEEHKRRILEDLMDGDDQDGRFFDANRLAEEFGRPVQDVLEWKVIMQAVAKRAYSSEPRSVGLGLPNWIFV